MKPLSRSTVFIVGLGQIGGSLAIDLTKRKTVKRVIGYDTNQSMLRLAKRQGAIHQAMNSLPEGLSEADLVVLAAPIRQIIQILPGLLGYLRRDQLCIDVAGSKRQVMEIADDCGAANFVGGHPIAGTERQGFAGATPGLFTDRTFVLVPARKTSISAMRAASRLVRSVGARPLILAAMEHDRLIAQTSHLPHILALALVRACGRGMKRTASLEKLIGGSFLGATRVARSSPDLIADMLVSNAPYVLNAVDRFDKALNEIRQLVADSDEKKVRACAKQAGATLHELTKRHANARRP